MKLLSKKEPYYELFQRSADNMVATANALVDMLANFDRRVELAKRIHDLEHEGDAITHHILERLNRTFVTPLDREDIHALASAMDDVVDFVDAAADTLVVYKIETPTPESKALAEVIVTSANEIAKAVTTLDDRREYWRISERCIEINSLENEADHITREALGKLFDQPEQVVNIIKWKDVYDLLETATDRCEDVADVLQTVVMKYA